MKKIIFSSLVATALLAGNTYQITPMIGYVNTKDHVDIENHAVVGIGASRILNEDSMFSALEVGLLQSGDADYENNGGDTKITQIFYNAVKDYKINDSFKLSALAGLGFEYISNQRQGNESDPFFNYGVGAAYTFANNMALKLDVRHQLKFDGDKNIVTLLGLAIPFGEKTQKQVEEIDSDNDGVVDSIDQCPTTKAGVVVDVNGCEIDSDNDGVVDSMDNCLSTPEGEAVNEKGCPIVAVPAPANLGIVFETNSAKIKSSDLAKFEKFVTYLEQVPTAKVILEAHTDSVGNAKYNLSLSQKRADSTKAQLVSMGIAQERITAIGYGETKPLVENNSAENMQKNRRVTATIEK